MYQALLVILHSLSTLAGVAYCMEPAAKRSTYNPVAAAMSVVQQAGVEHPQAQHSPTQQQVIPLALKAMMQHTQRSLLHKQDPHGGGRPPDTPGHPVALQTVQGNVSANFVASPVPLVQTVCCHQPVLGVLPLVDKESPVNKTETVAVKCAANMSPGLMMPWLHAAHVNMTHVADPGPVPLAQAAMAKAMQDAYTVSPMEPVVGTPTNVIQPAPAIAPTTPPDTPKADLDAAAKHLLGMFPQNMDLDLTTCQDVLATFQGDMETAAEHLMSMFSCSKHTSSRWDEPTAIPATPSPPVVSLLHSILPDAHLHYSSFEQNNQMDADAALAAKLQKEEEDAAQHHLANSDTSSNDEMPEQLALLLSPTEMYYAMNPTTNSNTATTECDVQAMHLPNPQQDSPHLSAFLLPDEALAASLVAEDQLFSAQSHDQRVKALCRELAPVLRSFFPDITLEEAQHVLEAFEVSSVPAVLCCVRQGVGGWPCIDFCLHSVGRMVCVGDSSITCAGNLSCSLPMSTLHARIIPNHPTLVYLPALRTTTTPHTLIHTIPFAPFSPAGRRATWRRRRRRCGAAARTTPTTGQPRCTRTPSTRAHCTNRRARAAPASASAWRRR